MLRSWNIAIGNFFFRYRNALFPLIVALGTVTLRPAVMFKGLPVDRILAVAGIVIALLGQTARLVTIGFQYIHRGGKDGQVYAGCLVRRGVYGMTRNPMYVGNGLIAIGMTMLLGSPLGYFLLIPLFLFVYQAMIAAEESYLRNKFGAEYVDYCATVNRFVPSPSLIRGSFSGMQFDWRRSVKKDLGTIVGLTIGLILIPAWRTYFLYGWNAAETAALRALGLCLAVTVLYLFLLKLKRTHRLFHGSSNPQKL